MNKKMRTLTILLAVLLIVSAAAFGISRYEEKMEEIRTSDEVIMCVDPDSVTALSWTYDGTTLSFTKNDEGWHWDEDEAFPADSEKLMDLLEQFREFGAAFVIEDPDDLGSYGLDKPTAEILITAGEDVYTVSLGDFSKMDEERYVSIGDGNAYLVKHDPLDDYDLDISDLILNDEIPTLTGASQMTLTGGDESYTAVYESSSEKSWCSDDTWFVGEAPLETSTVRSYLRNAGNLSLNTYASYNVTDEELAEFGLDAPELTVSVLLPADDDGNPEQTVVLYVSRNVSELADAMENSPDDLTGVTAYLRVGDSQIVYVLSYSDYSKLAAWTYDDLRHDEVMTASFDDIYQIDISLEGSSYTLSASDTSDDRVWHNTTGADLPAESTDEAEDEAEDTEEEDAEETSGEPEVDISDIEDAVGAILADSFTDETPAGKEEIELTFHLENENWPEIRLTLYRYDGSSCLAQINGETVALVSRSSVVDLIEAVNAIVLG